MPSLCGRQVPRTVQHSRGTAKKENQSVTRCYKFYHFGSLVCTCIVPLFRSLMKAFVAWTSIPACTKTGASNTAINTKPEAHPYFSGPHIGPCPSTHFQGLDPPPSPQTRGGSKGLGNSLEAWRVAMQVLSCICESFCSELRADYIVHPLALRYQEGKQTKMKRYHWCTYKYRYTYIYIYIHT